ncbi:MAG TPA: 5-oxoprolinase subunit PxpA [Thermoanaerobaculia bacterium]|nr:5-oxoprolinase subunit PxpA [Thermoanaerobaculia bacterium]
MHAIDLNADVGEGYTDERLLPWVTSVSVACGAHAGSAADRARVLAMARDLRLAVGAHPAYPDREGFGRRELGLPPETIAAEVASQVASLVAEAARQGLFLTHVKPHGALYHRAWGDPEAAAALCRGIAEVDRSLAVIGPPGSALLAAAEAAGLETLPEGYIDRRYASDGRLVPRERPGALLATLAESVAQALALARGEPIGAEGGAPIRLAVRTLCLHGDSPGAGVLVRELRRAFAEAGIAVRPALPPRRVEIS